MQWTTGYQSNYLTDFIFSKSFSKVYEASVNALNSYCQQVKSKQFPTTEHCYKMDLKEQEQLQNLIQKLK